MFRDVPECSFMFHVSDFIGGRAIDLMHRAIYHFHPTNCRCSLAIYRLCPANYRCILANGTFQTKNILLTIRRRVTKQRIFILEAKITKRERRAKETWIDK